MSRRPFIAGNWKLNKGPREAAELASALRERLAGVRETTLAVFPTALSLPAVADVLRGSSIALGVQEIEAKPSGAFTGANSGAMARELGCDYALVGHSERRQLWGETDERCAAKLVAAFGAGLLPIYCIGETLEERRAGKVEEVVFRQLKDGLAKLAPDQVGALTLAYEPVWAIGTGETATPEQAQAVHAAIRGWLVAAYGQGIGGDVRIQYGGSVNAKNARELLSCPDIDGALVGGASLEAASFAAIVEAAG
jgi:triosephosphate isomerase